MHRVVWLAETVFDDPDDRLLFTTYTRNLASDIEENLRLIASPEVLERIEVTNLDAWIRQFLRSQGYEYTIDYGKRSDDLWDRALMYKSLMRGDEPRVNAFDSFGQESQAIAEYVQERRAWSLSASWSRGGRTEVRPMTEHCRRRTTTQPGSVF
jgi:hypothetical protein